jgi:putative tryptophan/tyrosine transport system substrate-binding protein
MRRREFIAGLGALAWPIVARAQQPAMPVVAFLSAGSSYDDSKRVRALRQGLRESGYIEGQNITIEYR